MARSNLVGVEGTGSYGAGLTRHLTGAGIVVVEIDRPNRQLRRREGKSDPVDAVAAARAALSGQGLGRPKSRDGDVEAIRVLQVACRSAASERIATLCQLRHLVICADDQVRSRFEGLSVARLTAEAAALRPRPTETVRYSTLFAIRTLARRVAFSTTNWTSSTLSCARSSTTLRRGCWRCTASATTSPPSCSIAAGDNPDRLRSEAAFAHLCGVAPLEASSGKTRRHRLNRGGNRQANNALYRVVITRMASHQPTKDLRHPPPRRGQVDRRDRPHPQALRRPRSLQTPPPTPPQPDRRPDRRRSDPTNRPTPATGCSTNDLSIAARRPLAWAVTYQEPALHHEWPISVLSTPRPPLDNTGASIGGIASARRSPVIGRLEPGVPADDVAATNRTAPVDVLSRPASVR